MTACTVCVLIMTFFKVLTVQLAVPAFIPPQTARQRELILPFQMLGGKNWQWLMSWLEILIDKVIIYITCLLPFCVKVAVQS